MGLLDQITAEHDQRKQQSSHYLLYTLISQFTLIYSAKGHHGLKGGIKNKEKKPVRHQTKKRMCNSFSFIIIFSFKIT